MEQAAAAVGVATAVLGTAQLLTVLTRVPQVAEVAQAATAVTVLVEALLLHPPEAQAVKLLT
jgi:hypothetical protein